MAQSCCWHHCVWKRFFSGVFLGQAEDDDVKSAVAAGAKLLATTPVGREDGEGVEL